MTTNWQTAAAVRYHDGTKHPDGALFNRTYRWDPSDRPFPYKVFDGADAVTLPLAHSPDSVTALQALSSDVPTNSSAAAKGPTPSQLAALLHYSSGVTKVLGRGPYQMPFRACACTGALFHIELYLACADLPASNGSPALPAGLYHYEVRPNPDADSVTLRLLRRGDVRQVLIDATGAEPSVARAPAILLATDVVFRNAIKYRERAYRHTFWDTGTLLANTLAVASAHSIPAKIVLGFVDDTLTKLLDLDPTVELPVALIPVGVSPAAPPTAPPLDPLPYDVQTVRDYQRLFPAIRGIHDASSLTTPEEAAAWHGGLPRVEPPPTGPLTPLRPRNRLPRNSIETVIRRRGSTRRFAQDPITFRQLSTLLDRSLRALPADFLAHEHADPTDLPVGLSDLYLIVNAVDGLAPGSYVLHPGECAPRRGESAEGRSLGERSLDLLKPGNHRAAAYHLALDQDLAADAAVNLYWLSDLRPILERYGNRGYRAAQLEAATQAGRTYLAAFAQRFGATGLTFYDDEVTAFFSPHAAGKSVLFLMAFGHKPKP